MGLIYSFKSVSMLIFYSTINNFRREDGQEKRAVTQSEVDLSSAVFVSGDTIIVSIFTTTPLREIVPQTNIPPS